MRGSAEGIGERSEILILTELKEEEGEEVVLLRADLMAEMETEAGEPLQGLVKLVRDERSGQVTETKTFSDGAGVITLYDTGCRSGRLTLPGGCQSDRSGDPPLS